MSGKSKLLLHWCIFNTIMWLPFVFLACYFNNIGITIFPAVASLISCIPTSLWYEGEKW